MWWTKALLFGTFLFVTTTAAKCPNVPQGTAKLVCYYEGRKSVQDVDPCGCTHLVYTGEARGDDLAEISKKLLERKPKLKILLRTNGKDKELPELIKSSTIHGVDLYEAHSLLNRTKIIKTTESIRSALGSDGILMMTLPAQSELLAKYYDLKSLIKPVTLFATETHLLGEVENETFHPSRLSGVWDMLNTDSVVDLAIGLGVPSAKIIITSPAKAFKFILKNTTLSTPGSPTKDKKPVYLNQIELCKELNNGDKWTLERDQDLSAPYAFNNEKWLAFEDVSSLDVKGKYARVRGLAGLGLVAIDDDAVTDCGASLLQTIAKGLGSQSRAPRGALLSSLENEILAVPHSSRLVDGIQLSPYRISRVVDSDGVIHAIREDTRTEFECQRQGYFVHPRTCNRFYRCVKFDQLSDEFTVFEFDCPAGLAFDSRYEVCVWPGSLSDAQACPGSSEIAPVPKARFVCPEKPGYYADPANCRWFFACLDHGKSPFSAYEFRCPFGLGFDESRLICDWPWLVPGCGNLGKYESNAYGHGSSALIGASAYNGASANSVNIAAHQSLISGASTDNLVGIQSGYGSHNSGEGQGYDSGAYIASGISGDGGYGQYELSGGAQIHSAGGGAEGAQILSTGFGNGYSGGNGAYVAGSGAYNSAGSGAYNSAGSGAYNSAGSGAYNNAGSGAYNSAGSGAYNSGSGAYNSGSGAYNSAGSGAYKSVDSGAYNSGSGAYNSGSGAYNSAGSGAYNSGSGVYNAGSGVYNSGSGVYNAGNGVYNSAGSGAYNGAESGAYNAGSEVYNAGSGVYNAGSGAYNAGSGAYNAGSGVYNAGSGVYNTGNSVYSAGSGAYNSASGAYNAGNGAYSVSNVGKIGNGLSSSYISAGQTGSGYVGSQNVLLNKVPVASSVSFGKGYSSESGDSSGAYYHDDSGEYKHDYSGEYQESAVPYKHVSSGVVSYAGSNGGIGLSSSNLLYKGDGSGQYNSGSYYNDNSGSYKGDLSSGSSYTDNSGQYKSYQYGQNSAANVGALASNVYVNHGSTGQQLNSAYSGGLNAYSGYTATGGAHTLTAGAINAGLVGKTTLVDTQLLHNNAYATHGASAQSGSHQYSAGLSYSQPSVVTSQNINHGQQTYSGSHLGNAYSQQSGAYNQYESGNANINAGYSFSTSAPIVKTQQALYVTPSVQTVAHIVSPPKTTLTQGVFGVQKQAVSYVQPIVVSSTPKTFVQQPYQQSYNYQTVTSSPSVATVTQAPIVHYQPQYYESSTPKVSIITYQKPAVSLYKNPLLPVKNVTPIPTIASVPAYSTYISQPSTVQYLKPTISSYNYDTKNTGQVYQQQNAVFHNVQPSVQTYDQVKYIQAPVVQQTYQKPSVSHQTFTSHNQYVKPVVSSTVVPLTYVSEQNQQSQSYSAYKAPDYLPPKVEYKQPIYVSSTPASYQQSYSTLNQKVSYQQQQPLQVKHEYEYSKPEYTFVSSTPTPIKYEQQSVVHKYETPKVVYSQPAYVSSTQAPIQYQQQSLIHKYESPKAVFTQPEFVSTYVSSTQTPIKYQQQSVVHTYEAPKAVYTQPEFVSTYVSPTPVPIKYQQHTYEAPKTVYTQQAYVSSTPAPVKFQQSYIHKYEAPKTVVSSTFAPIKYEQHSTVYESPKLLQPVYSSTPASLTYQVQNQNDFSYQYKTPAKVQYVQPIVSSTPAIVKFERTFNYKQPQTYITPKVQQPLIQISSPAPFAYEKPSKVVESFHISSNYNSDNSGSNYNSYASSTPRPYTYEQTYQEPKFVQSSTYLPPKVNVVQHYTPTAAPVAYKTVTQPSLVTSVYKGPDYLPPVKASVGYNQENVNVKYVSLKQRPLKIVSSTTPLPTYRAPVSYNVNPIQEFAFNKISVSTEPSIQYKRPVLLQQNYAPVVKVTQRPVELNEYSSTYGYTGDSSVNLLGFGTVGPNAGLVRGSGYSTIATEKYIPVTQNIIKKVTPTYAPVIQQYVEPIVRRPRPKVAVVTKVNDFNPLIVKKLGAVCSCRSNVLRLRKPKPNVEYENEYENDYDVPVNGDNDEEWTYKSGAFEAEPQISSTYASVPVIRKQKITVVSSTLNPIIVPDESPSYEEEYNYRPQVKSTLQPIIVTDNYPVVPIVKTEKVRPYRIRTRVNAVTAAPTLATVLIPKSQTLVDVSSANAFDRYGPGGWRGRDETLQGTVDCKRVGLFRHPKHCNKFYSCRWDCTKKRFTLHVFNCPVQLSFDPSMGACNWPSQGPACQGDTLLPSGY